MPDAEINGIAPPFAASRAGCEQRTHGCRVTYLNGATFAHNRGQLRATLTCADAL